MAANPAMAGMPDGNPRLKQLLTSPEAIQRILSGGLVMDHNQVSCERDRLLADM